MLFQWTHTSWKLLNFLELVTVFCYHGLRSDPSFDNVQWHSHLRPRLERSRANKHNKSILTSYYLKFQTYHDGRWKWANKNHEGIYVQLQQIEWGLLRGLHLGFHNKVTVIWYFDDGSIVAFQENIWSWESVCPLLYREIFKDESENIDKVPGVPDDVKWECHGSHQEVWTVVISLNTLHCVEKWTVVKS